VQRLHFKLTHDSLPERAALNLARSFAQGEELVGRDGLDGLDQPGGPVDLDVRRRCSSEAEVQARIVRREKAGLAQHLLDLYLAPYRASTRAPIALRLLLVPSRRTLIQRLPGGASLRSRVLNRSGKNCDLSRK
jgi:hypothetical protein